MEKKISLFLAILTLGFAQQIFAQDENASAGDSERWSDFLPLSKELAGDADLPLPFGIGVIGYWQEQDLKSVGNIGLGVDLGGAFDLLELAELQTAGTGLTVAARAAVEDAIGALTGGVTTSVVDTTATATKVESEVDNYNVRLDAWVFPFLNIYGVVGKVEGENTVSGVSVTDNWSVLGSPVKDILDPLKAGVDANGFKIDYEGDVFGFGAILAGQWGKYWGTIDYNFTQTDLDIITSEIDTHTISPRIGRLGSLGNVKGSLWIGAMHQAVDEVHNGKINYSGIDVEFNARNEQENEWNFLLGGAAELSERIHVGIEGGLGDRKQVMGNLTFRF
jgi:hypothetical protein